MKYNHFILSFLLFAVAGEAFATDISILGLFRDKAMVKIDGKQRILKLGKASPEGVLLISSNSSEAIIEINGVQNSYRLGSHIGSSFKQDAQPEVSIYKDEHGMFAVVGSINNFPVNFLVDTGATYIAMNKHEARRLGIDYRQYGQRSFSSTANGVVKTWDIVLNKVQVGDVTLHNVKGSVLDGDSPRIVLLGMSFLGQLEMKNQGSSLKLKKKF